MTSTKIRSASCTPRSTATGSTTGSCSGGAARCSAGSIAWSRRATACRPTRATRRGSRRDAGMVAPASPYTPRPLETDAAALEAYRALLGVTTAPCELSYLQWLYRDNPCGHVVGFNAYAGDELAAHYATIPVEATLDGAPARGLLSLNTATHPTHQGKGLFTRLAERTYARASELGYE